MNRARRNTGVAQGNRYLMEVAHYITCCVDSGYGGALVIIDLQISAFALAAA